MQNRITILPTNKETQELINIIYGTTPSQYEMLKFYGFQEECGKMDSTSIYESSILFSGEQK